MLPSSLRKLSSSLDFGELCIQAFRTFIEVETEILILEGSAFQNTVRFMFANGRSATEILDYIARWAEAVTPARPRLLMFEVADPTAHYTKFIARRRGATWMEKLVAYVESTPIAQNHEWRGVDGFVRFWTDYQQLCLSCASALPWPVRLGSGLVRSWNI